MSEEFANFYILNNGNVNVLIFKFPVHLCLCDNPCFLHSVDEVVRGVNAIKRVLFIIILHNFT